MKKILHLLTILLILSCAKKDFNEGSCVISPDGIIFKINKVQDDQYTAQKWKGNMWETEISLKFSDVSLSNGFGANDCPQQ